MKADLKREWVKALLSGKFMQAKNSYEKGGAYCCLGVLTCVYLKKKVDEDICDKWWGKRPRGDSHVPSNERVETLIHLNDSGRSFKYIAAYIKRYV